MKKFSVFYLFLTINSVAYAEITTDGSLGAIEHLQGQMVIPQSLGTTVGNNLFHSFQIFNINSGESATFTGSNALQNVISRVTGGQISTIDGLLKSEIAHANFYFINPAGVTFGTNAQVDVPAAFHVSTANYLKFADGAQFSASDPNASTFSIAEPQSFGFMGNQTGNIEMNGSELRLKNNSFVSLSGGNIAINQAHLRQEGQKAKIVCDIAGCETISILDPMMDALIDGITIYMPDDTKPGSSLKLSAVGNAQTEILLKPKPVQALAGQLTINDSVLDASGNGGGYLSLNAGDINISQQSQLLASNVNTMNADDTKGIDIVANNLRLSQGSKIEANVVEAGNGGSISVKSNNVTLQDKNSQIGVVNSSRGGRAGDITIDANTIKVLNGSRITAEMGESSQTDSSMYGVAQSIAGNIRINAQELTLDGEQSTDLYSTITAVTWPTAVGTAGNIIIHTDTLNLLNLSDISTTNLSSYGVTNGGKIDISANTLKISGGLAGIHSGNFYSGSTAGDISIHAKLIDISQGGAIVASSSTISEGKAGNINITAETIKIDGLGERTDLPTGIVSDSLPFSFNVADFKKFGLAPDLLTYSPISYMFFFTDMASGAPGNITINTQSLSISHGGVISSASQPNNAFGTSSNGGTGNISITATKNIHLASNGLITNRSDAGLQVVNFDLSPEGDLSFGFVNPNGLAMGQEPGSLNINTPYLQLDNSQVSSNTTTFTNGGGITLNLDRLELLNGSSIASTTTSYGDAGTITINAADQVLLTQSNISTASSGSGIGGEILINTPQLTLNNEAKIAATSNSHAPSGNIELQAGAIELNNESSIIAANTGSGAAGSVTIHQNNALVLDNNSSLSVTLSHLDNPETNKTVYINPTTQKPWTRAEFLEKFIAVFGDDVFVKSIAKVVGNFSLGDAGNVNITSHAVTLLNQSSILSDTQAQGSSGSISVNASNITLDNASISAAAAEGSSGQIGYVNVSAADTLQLTGKAKITIQNDATLANPVQIKTGLISVFAAKIGLKNSSIIAESTKNVDASDIHVKADALIMNNAVIQANAGTGKGGNLNLDLHTLIPNQNQLIKGGAQVVWQPFIEGFNVIQAASANGVNGTVNVSSPQFNISGSISGLDSAALTLPIINHTVCEGSTTPASTLVATSKGGIPDDGLEFSFIPQLKLQSLSEITQNISIPIHLSTLKTLKKPCAMLSL